MEILGEEMGTKTDNGLEHGRCGVSTTTKGKVLAGNLEELKARGCTVVTGAGHTIAVFAQGDHIYALDNRCPHMGFPLSQGTVQDGILTCHWHHARFDLASGDTFDLFAGDIPRFSVEVVDGQVWVDPTASSRDAIEYWKHRLADGLEHNIRLVIARSVIGMMGAGADYCVPLEIGALFGARYTSSGWTAAMSILTACANMLPMLRPEDRPLAMYHGLTWVAQECAGKPPRFPIEPLSSNVSDVSQAKSWFRQFIEVRDEEAAERTLRSAVDSGLPQEAVADMIFSAITDHLFIDGGHTIDFANKAFELLDHIGWKHAGIVLTSLVPQMCGASRSEESSNWRHPIDVAELIFQAYEELPSLWEKGQGANSAWKGERELVEQILQDDPAETVATLKRAVADGADPESLGSAVTQAAFKRLALFHLSNEFGDWNTAHHCVTTAHAAHQALRRAPSTELLRGLFDTAMSIYHARFLNVPPAALPKPNGRKAKDRGEESLLSKLLAGMDKQQQVGLSARLVSEYLAASGSTDALLATIGHAMLREDAGFHQFQMAESALEQCQIQQDNGESEKIRTTLLGAVRFLAAHSPTVRSAGQTYHTAFRLERGDHIFQDD